MDKRLIDYYNSSVKYLALVLILTAFLTGSQDQPCGNPASTGSFDQSCASENRVLTSADRGDGLVQRLNMTHKNDDSVCESCHSGWCESLLRISNALFKKNYTVAQCLEPTYFQWPADPLMFPPQEQKATPKHRKPQPFLSHKGRSLHIKTKI